MGRRNQKLEGNHTLTRRGRIIIMVLKHNYYYFTKAIPLKTCKKIIKEGRKKIIQQATTVKGMDKKARDCKVAWINEKWIYDIINPFIHTANKNAGWNFQFDWNETSQFTTYGKGDYYGWHIDQSDTPKKDKNKNFDGKIRKLSLTLQLTDPSQYEGGNLQLKWLSQDAKIKTVTIKEGQKCGTIIIFPSFIFHRITPITKGTRQSLVNWSLGDVFK